MLPWVTWSTVPTSTAFIPSVATSEVIPRRVTSRPLSSPAARPTPSTTTRPRASLPGSPPGTTVTSTTPSEKVPGTDRSRPPCWMTRVWPMAAMARIPAKGSIACSALLESEPCATIGLTAKSRIVAVQIGPNAPSRNWRRQGALATDGWTPAMAIPTSSLNAQARYCAHLFAMRTRSAGLLAPREQAAEGDRPQRPGPGQGPGPIEQVREREGGDGRGEQPRGPVGLRRGDLAHERRCHRDVPGEDRQQAAKAHLDPFLQRQIVGEARRDGALLQLSLARCGQERPGPEALHGVLRRGVQRGAPEAHAPVAGVGAARRSAVAEHNGGRGEQCGDDDRHRPARARGALGRAARPQRRGHHDGGRQQRHDAGAVAGAGQVAVEDNRAGRPRDDGGQRDRADRAPA